LKIVTISSMAPMIAEISVKVMVCAQTSTRFPGPNSGPDSGVYANHPASGPVLTKNAA
jgi:hypothetical protein